QPRPLRRPRRPGRPRRRRPPRPPLPDAGGRGAAGGPHGQPGPRRGQLQHGADADADRPPRRRRRVVPTRDRAHAAGRPGASAGHRGARRRRGGDGAAGGERVRPYLTAPFSPAMSPVPRPRTLFGALFLVLVGCRTAAPPAAPEPLPEPPPRPAPVAEPPAEAPPPVKTPRYEPVPAGVYESRSTYPQAGVTEWRMTSGARLVFRPSRTSPRSVTLYAFAPGGFAAVPDDLAGAALALSTAGGAAAGADAAVQPAVREREALLLGTASTGALEALFQQVRRAMETPE